MVGEADPQYAAIRDIGETSIALGFLGGNDPRMVIARIFHFQLVACQSVPRSAVVCPSCPGFTRTSESARILKAAAINGQYLPGNPAGLF